MTKNELAIISKQYNVFRQIPAKTYFLEFPYWKTVDQTYLILDKLNEFEEFEFIQSRMFKGNMIDIYRSTKKGSQFTIVKTNEKVYLIPYAYSGILTKLNSIIKEFGDIPDKFTFEIDPNPFDMSNDEIYTERINNVSSDQ